jgi:hypothetical protein
MPTEEEENTIFGDVSGDINIGFGDNQINDRDQRQFRVNPNAVRPDGIPVIKDITFPPALSSFSDNKSPDANFQYVRFQAFHRKGNQANVAFDANPAIINLNPFDTNITFSAAGVEVDAIESQQGTGQANPETNPRFSRANADEPSDIIRLYIPNELDFTDNVEYVTESTGDVGKILESVIGGNAGRLAELGSLGVLKKLDNMASTFVEGLDQSIRAKFGFAVNPREEALFKNTTLKTFNMKFTFSPRNKSEVESVYNIIESFRFHMMPELSPSTFVLFAPAEFEIDFLYNDFLENPTDFAEFRINNSLPRLGRCLLKSVGVNYSPNAKSSFFRDGTATEINMDLSFMQAAHLNRQMIMKGF